MFKVLSYLIIIATTHPAELIFQTPVEVIANYDKDNAFQKPGAYISYLAALDDEGIDSDKDDSPNISMQTLKVSGTESFILSENLLTKSINKIIYHTSEFLLPFMLDIPPPEPIT